MEPGHEAQKPSQQPKLWLIGIALALGVGAGVALAQSPGDPRNPLFQGPWLFGVSAVVQTWLGWALIRAGEKPQDSLLADLLRERLQSIGAVAELKPLLWSLAFVVLMLAGISSTMFVALALDGSQPVTDPGLSGPR